MATKVATFQRKRIHKSRAMTPSGRRRMRTRSLIPRREVYIRKGKAKIRRILPYKKRVFKRFAHPKRYTYAFNKFDKTFATLIRSWLKKQTEWSPVKRKTSYTKSYADKKFTTSIPRTRGHKSEDVISPTQFGHAQRRINEQRKHHADRRPKPIVKKVERRGGARLNHSWKGTNKFGPAGPLGPHLIISIYATTKLRAMLRKEIERRGEYVPKIIKEAIDTFRDNLIKYSEKIIAIYVPKETGDLQKSLIKKLKEGKRRGYNLKIEIASDQKMQYAKPVNRMPEKMIQHPKRTRRGNPIWEIGRRSKKRLFDPKSQKGFYGLVRMLIKKKAKELLGDMYETIITTTRKPGRGISPRTPRTTPTISPHLRPKEYSVRDAMGWFYIKGLLKR